MQHECPNAQPTRPLNSQGGDTAEPPPAPRSNTEPVPATRTKLQPTSMVPSPPSSSPNPAIDLIGRVDDADILWVTFRLWFLSIQEHRFPPLLGSSVNNTGITYTP